MSKPQTALALISPDVTPAQVEKLLAALAGRQKCSKLYDLFFRAVQGGCLQLLRQSHGHLKGGGDTRSTSARCGGETWAGIVKSKYGFSDDTAARRMALWDSMVPRLKSLSEKERHLVGDLLARPILNPTEAEEAVLEKITDKLATVADEQEELAACKHLKGGHGTALLDQANDPKNRGKGQRLAPDKQLELFIDDGIFGRLPEVEAMVKTWYKPLKVGAARVPVWEHMSGAQKKKALEQVAPLAAKLADMAAQLKEALGRK